MSLILSCFFFKRLYRLIYCSTEINIQVFNE
jgi:hypothetical protein